MYPPRSKNKVFVRRPRIRENVNEAIRVKEVRAVFPDGQVEILPTPVAIRRAKDLGLDLILVAPTANPPVAKAMDFGQWQYEQKKKKNEAKKKQHVIQVKELKFRPNTKGHDYEFKKKHAIRFLKEGNRVKAVVQFRGREIAHMDLGKALLMKLASEISEFGTVEGQPRLEGRFFHIILTPTKAAIQAGLKEKQEKLAASQRNKEHPASAAQPEESEIEAMVLDEDMELDEGELLEEDEDIEEEGEEAEGGEEDGSEEDLTGEDSKDESGPRFGSGRSPA